MRLVLWHRVAKQFSNLQFVKMGSVSPPSPCLTVRRWVPIPIYGVKQCKRFAVWETSTGLAQPKYWVFNWPIASSSRSLWVLHSRGERIDSVMELYKSCTCTHSAEKKNLYTQVRSSQVDGGGEGLYARRNLVKGEIVAFYNGVLFAFMVNHGITTLLFKGACNDNC